MRASGKTSQSHGLRVLPLRRNHKVDDFDDNSIPMVVSVIENFKHCHLVLSIVTKCRDDMVLDDGLKALEPLTLKIILDLIFNC